MALTYLLDRLDMLLERMFEAMPGIVTALIVEVGILRHMGGLSLTPFEALEIMTPIIAFFVGLLSIVVYVLSSAGGWGPISGRLKAIVRAANVTTVNIFLIHIVLRGLML